jgi:NADPH-dependent 2,4-dienoyl-CoA reductase/sulfur reductase-like enzyme/nitrite reductase/ring-hydroxylating ferredoxin subunit
MKFEKVARVDDLHDGEMKGVRVGDKDILLSRIDGAYFAVAAFCPHYGAPLEMGILSKDRIVCPWHHACFNAKTGGIEEPPSRDALTVYEVKIEGEDILVSVPDEDEGHHIPPMVTLAPQSELKTFAIIGAGAAGNAAAQALRENEFMGRIDLITPENRLPYDRPNLSKDYLAGKADEAWMPLRSSDFYQKHGIDIVKNRKVTSVVSASKTITFDNNQTKNYDAILIATGGKAKMLNVPGAGLRNIFTLRSYDDCDRIIAACENAGKVVIVGASFIAMETASSLSQRGLEVTVVAPETVPFEKLYGKEIGDMFKKLHEENGVQFRLGEEISSFDGKNTVQSVELENGNTITTDMVIVGVGVEPVTGFMQGFDLHADGSINVDEYFQAAEGIYAAGDVARFPYWQTGEHVRIEHWRTAEQQGRIAGQNMAGQQVTFTSVPFFWTTQFNLLFRYVGYVADWDEMITLGDIQSQEFISFYIKNNEIFAAAGTGRDVEIAGVGELLRLKKMPGPDELPSTPAKIAELLKI